MKNEQSRNKQRKVKIALKDGRFFASRRKMLKPEDFFDLSQTRFNNLFDNTEYVWDALKKLKKYIVDNIKPNVSSLRKGEIFINKTLVLYDDKIIESGFDISILKKKLIIKKDGEILDGASVIYAGAILMDDEICIGKGTVIESGVFIKGPYQPQDIHQD